MSSSHLFFLSAFVVCLVFPLSLCLASWFWPDLMNGRHVHTTSVCIPWRWLGDLRVVRLPAGSWRGLPRWWHGLCRRSVVSRSSTSQYQVQAKSKTEILSLPQPLCHIKTIFSSWSPYEGQSNSRETVVNPGKEDDQTSVLNFSSVLHCPMA